MIPQYQVILYTTDLAPNSRQVLRHALGVAQKFNAKVHILHVVPEMDSSHKNYLAALIGEEKYKEQAEGLNQEVIAKLKGRLQGMTEEEFADHPEYVKAVTSIEVLHGHPTEQILQTADRINADLLVFGNHDKGASTFDLLGSVVKRVLRRTRRPVLVVPVGG